MTRNQQWALIAIAAVLGAALVIGFLKKQNGPVVIGGKTIIEGTATPPAVGRDGKPVRYYTGAPPAPRGDYDPKLAPTMQAVMGQFRMLEAALARAIMKKKLGYDDLEKLHFGGAADNVDPAYAVFNPDGHVRFRPMAGAWVTQAELDLLTTKKGMRIYYSLRRQSDNSGTTDGLYAVIPSPTEKFCKRAGVAYTTKAALKFAADNTQIVTDEANAIPNNAMKVPACITSGDGRVYYFHPLRTRFLRKGGAMWQGR